MMMSPTRLRKDAERCGHGRPNGSHAKLRAASTRQRQSGAVVATNKRWRLCGGARCDHRDAAQVLTLVGASAPG